MSETYNDSLTGLESKKPLVGLTNLETNNVDDLYVFGDSLSDIGNTYTLSTLPIVGDLIPDTPPSPPYFDGRFTNGPTWVEMLAEDLDVEDLTASTDLSIFGSFEGGTVDRSVNFAYGGAETEGNTGLRALLPDLLDQVAQFTQDSDRAGQMADAEDLFVVWAGANDYLFDASAKPKDVVNNIIESVEELYDRGARNFLVPNLPDLGKTPGAIESHAINGDEIVHSSEKLTKLTDRHNKRLARELENLEDDLSGDIKITTLDVNSLFDRLIEQPQDFGITTIDRPFLDESNPTMGDSPDRYLFWDDIHPTAFVHRILAEAAASVI
jgi:phospholipase/lecithinase/hemolysin